MKVDHVEIEIEPPAAQRFRVHYAGRVLIERARDPERDACRALLALGITARLHTRWRADS